MEFPNHNLVSGLNDGSYIPATSSFWADVDCSSKALGFIPNQMLHVDQLNTSDFLSRKLIDARVDVYKALQSVSSDRDGLFPDTQGVVQVYLSSYSHHAY